MAEPKITGAMRITDGNTDLRTLKELNTLLTTLNTNMTNLTNSVNSLKPKLLYYNTSGGTNVALNDTVTNYDWFIIEWGCQRSW